MHNKKDIILRSDMKISELIFENPVILLLLEHFGLDYSLHGKTIREMCEENKISINVFMAITNMYNGFSPSGISGFSAEDLRKIILFLHNSHNYYENEKYPEIKRYIEEIYLLNKTPEIKLIGKFFNEYFEEVKEHLTYENEVAFPYFNLLLSEKIKEIKQGRFSVAEYREHHTDIECKLGDLKELLLNHIPIQNDRVIRRKIIISLFELEWHLNVHSQIEETILMPLIAKLEKEIND